MVSIITPCYNSEEFIADTIRSVQAQTYQDWEMLIVDDCSTDNSYRIASSFAESDPRIKVFKTDSPSGSPVTPRNLAISRSSGKYIAFLDSDDLWLPSKLESQIRLLGEHDDAAVAFSYYEKISEQGERAGRVIKSPAQVTYRQLLRGNVIGCLTGVYDAEKVGRIMLQHRGHEDYVMWLNILRKGYLAVNTNDVQALYRIRGGSVSANKLKVLSWQWSIYRDSEKLGLLASIYYFVWYAVQAFMKSIK